MGSKDRSYSTAIHLLSALAYHGEKLVSSEYLAVGLKTNPGLVRRMLCKLSQAGLVETVKGKNGGSRLAKSPSKIGLDEIYQAVNDGPLFGSFDKEPFKKCPVSCNMGKVLPDLYDELEDSLVTKMKSIKLSNVLEKIG